MAPTLQTFLQTASPRFFLRTLLVLLSLPATTPGLLAHPHVWVDISVEPEFNQTNHLTALNQIWTFDTFYSAILAEEMEAGSTEQLLKDIVANLTSQDYYTRIEANDNRLPTLDAINPELIRDQSRVHFRFRLPLADPVPRKVLAENGLEYRIYEPGYYMELRHREDDPVRFSDAHSGCGYRLNEPEPTQEQIRRASDTELDRTDNRDPSLGRHFAQTVELRCDS